MSNQRLLSSFTLALAVTAGAVIVGNGAFRFLTLSLPQGTTNAEYAARFVTANADGPVTFSTLSTLPAGLSLDPLSGFLTGIPTATYNSTIDIVADDGTQQITNNVLLKINAAGGGGNGGASFSNATLTVGRVGVVYSNQLTIAGGVGPFTFAAKDLPPGISLNGQTGILSGNPSAAGRFYVTVSAFDAGEGNNSATVLPLLVLPAESDFEFVTQSLNNGEVGTPYYDAYLVTNAVGTVRFAASGLPAGLTLDAVTGIVSGTPSNAGTFELVINATDDHDTIASAFGMLVVPSDTSHFYWNVFALPAGLLGVGYDRQPPITVAAVNGTSVSYSATGLPPGIAYNSLSGELTGTPTQIGEFNTVFTATDSTTSEVLTYAANFVILPATGGDINSVPVNFWLTKQKVTLGDEGRESWSGTLVFNADRRTGVVFDPAIDELTLALGSRSIVLPAGALQGTTASSTYKSPAGLAPSEAVKLSLTKQTLGWKTGSDSLAVTVPGTPTVVLTLGAQSYRTAVSFGAQGTANAFAAARPSFVLTKGKLTAGNAGSDAAAFGLLLSDASFLYNTGDTLRIRLLEGATVLVDRDFTELGVGVSGTDKNGKLVYALSTTADTNTVNVIKKFSYSSAKGRLGLALANLTLGALSNGEAHVTVELTVGDRAFTTGVTFFGTNPGAYKTVMP